MRGNSEYSVDLVSKHTPVPLLPTPSLSLLCYVFVTHLGHLITFSFLLERADVIIFMINTLVQLIVIIPYNHSCDRQLLIFASLECFSLSEFLEFVLTEYTCATN